MYLNTTPSGIYLQPEKTNIWQFNLYDAPVGFAWQLRTDHEIASTDAFDNVSLQQKPNVTN